ncbi:hypothetical protein [Sinorhizobium prairiense]|uniref:hypothetical protein n=1 Tax=Sinorhizobium sp. C101 TaxID=2976819 RepID=UPI0023D82E43|nr:hypothetical protein [Sinorhizobium sp. C101]WEJ36260.1 hypothetical protein N0R80_14365 [Sinorhizobium sp. C101]
MEKKNYAADNLVWGTILLVLAYWYFSSGEEPNPADTAATTAALEKKDAECAADLDCWASKWQARAGLDCQEPVQRLAKNNFEWTDGWTEPKLPRALWLDQSEKTVTYVGDKIKFQNGFGAWIIHTYECDYDPTTRTVLSVRANPGQL